MMLAYASPLEIIVILLVAALTVVIIVGALLAIGFKLVNQTNKNRQP